MKNLLYTTIVVIVLGLTAPTQAQTIKEYVNLVTEECSAIAYKAVKEYEVDNYTSQAIFFSCLQSRFEETVKNIQELIQSKQIQKNTMHL